MLLVSEVEVQNTETVPKRLYRPKDEETGKEW